MYRNEKIVVRTEIATRPAIDGLKRIGFPLRADCFGECDGLFFGYQENRSPTRRNLHGVSERLFTALKPRTLPKLASTENRLPQCGRKEGCLAGSRASWLRQFWSCRPVSRPLAVHVRPDRFSRKHQRLWGVGI